MAGLPARDFEEIRLAEAVERGGCPICDARHEATHNALRGMAREGATDRGFRATLDKGVWFCRPHSAGLAKMELLQTSSQLATSVLLEAILRRKLAAMARLTSGDGAAQARTAGEIAAPRCPICARADEAVATARSRLLALAADQAWAAALGRAELCLDDLLGLWGAAATSSRDVQARWAPIGRAQLDRLEALRRLLADFAHNSTSDRRHLITAEQQAAEQASIRLFSGFPDRDRNR